MVHLRVLNAEKDQAWGVEDESGGGQPVGRTLAQDIFYGCRRDFWGRVTTYGFEPISGKTRRF
jgi:hypothetical protein